MSTLTTCPGCGADVASESARWCGRCGASLGRSRQDLDAPVAIHLAEEELAGGEEEQLPRTGQRVAVGVVIAVVVGLLALQGGTTETLPELGFADRGDPARSGVVSAAELAVPTEVLWRTPVEGGTASRFRHVGLGDDALAVGSGEGLTLHRRSDGRVLWHRPEVETSSAPVVLDDVVVIADQRLRQLVGRPLRVERAHLAAYAREDGSFRWGSQVEFGDAQLFPHPSGVIVLDGSREARLIDLAVGAAVWTIDGLDLLNASIRGVYPTDDPDTVHLLVTRPAGIDPRSTPAELVTEHLVAVDAHTGELRYEVTTQPDTLTFDPFDVAGQVAAGIDNRRLWFWNARSGERITVASHGFSVPPMAVAVTPDVVAVMDLNGVIVGFDPISGDRRWGLQGGPGEGGTLVTSGESLLAIGAGRVSVVNPSTGSLRSTFELPGFDVAGPPPEPAIDPEGGLLVATAEGRIHLLDETGGRLLDARALVRPWPVPATRGGFAAVQTPAGVSLFDAGSGTRRWRLASSPKGVAPNTLHAPVVTEEHVVVSPPGQGSRVAESGVSGIDRENAVYAWSRSDDRLPPNGPLTLADETVYVAIDDEVHGYDVLTGRRSFAANAGHPRGAVALHREYALASTSPDATSWDESHRGADPGIIAIRRHDRTTAWVKEIGACTAPVVDGDTVIVATFDEVVAVDVHRGGDLWRRQIDAPSCLDLTVSDGTVVVSEGRHRLVAFDTELGDNAWRVDLEGTLVAPPTVVADTLVVPLLEGEVRGYSMADGSESWRFDLGGTPASSVTVDGDRYLVLTREGDLVAFGG